MKASKVKVKEMSGLLIVPRYDNYPRPENSDDFAQIRIKYPDRTVIVRGDPKQTLDEFLMTLFERAGEKIEVIF